MLIKLGLVVVGAWMVLTTAGRVQVWSGPERGLWHEAVAHSPQKPRPWVNLGNQYLADGADVLAAEAYTAAAALALAPQRARVEGPMRGRHVALLNLAILRAQHGRVAEALALTAEIQPRGRHGYSLVDHLEAQWRQGAGFSGF